MTKRVLIADDLHAVFMQGLEEAGIAYDYLPGISEDGIRETIDRYAVLVIRSKINADASLLDRAPNLKIIARAGSGMDNIDEDYARSKGIVCINAPEANRDAVAEMAVGLMMALLRNICSARDEVRQHKWLREENRGLELCDTTVAIIGFGHTGSCFARKVAGLGCRVIFYDKFRKNIPTPFAEESFWEQISETADVVSFHIPLLGENRGLINKQLISSFKKPVFLLNLSRGGIMNTDDIVWGLETGRLRGVALDVLENEKLSAMTGKQRENFEFLTRHPRAIITPHVAGWTTASYRKISEVLLAKLKPLMD